MTRPLFLLASISALVGSAQAAPRFTAVATAVPYVNGIVNAGDGSNRLFLVAQDGEILVQGGGVARSTFLDVTALTNRSSEQGLLGLVFAPDYATSGLFYINYTDTTGGDSVVAEYKVSSTDPNQADSASGRILLVVDQPYTNHNGGGLQFGPDGYLYIGFGDGGDADDPGERAQDMTELLGKMLRIDPDPSAGDAPDCDLAGDYSIPTDNPFVDGAGGDCDEIWAYGLRNPWRYSFDSATGDLYIGDVGQNLVEEVDMQPAGSAGGENYGWDITEGDICHEPTSGCSWTGLTDPIVTYDHTGGRCSITGGYVYHGTAVPSLEGQYVYGDYCTGEIFAARLTASGWTSRVIRDTAFYISSFGETESGQLCFANYARMGAVYCYLP